MRQTKENGILKYTVLTSYGNTHLGGVDIDNELMTYVLQYLDNNYHDEYTTLFNNANTSINNNNMNKLKYIVQLSKECASNGTITCMTSGLSDMRIDMFVDDIDIPKDEWNGIVNNIGNKAVEIVNDCFKRSNIKKEDIDRVLLIGGTTKIAEISDKFKQGLNKRTIIDFNRVDKQKAVAFGATIEAYRIKN